MQNIKNLMERYNISRQGIMSFVDRHIEEINSDGEIHARQTSEGWQFDETAVKIMDKLRGLSEIAIIEHEESEQVQELKNEVENLKNMLLMTQSKLLQKQEELTESHKLLSQAEKKFLTAENAGAIEELKRQHLAEKLLASEKQLKNLQSEMDKLKSRSLLDRLFNNF